jgi:Domain of unknown function (DUF4157)
MRTFAQKPKATQQADAATSATPDRARLGQTRDVHSILHVQRTIGNHTEQRMLQTKPDGLEAVSSATASGHFGHDFSRIPVFSTDRTSRPQPSSPLATEPLPAAVQAKLVVGQANDPLEHEADRIADQVMRMPAPPRTARGATLQRKCAACEEEARSVPLRAKHYVLESSGTEAPAAVDEVLRSAGEPLDAQARTFFEPRFGRDFSQVRVHANDRAARSAQSIGALAYTVGPHIAFAAGQYAPGGERGRHLLAHELAHTVQQGQSRIQLRPGADQQGVTGLVDRPEEFDEIEASAIEVAGPIEQRVQRSATWKGATVHETLNMAEIAISGDSPVTRPLLNGTKLVTLADGAGAIKVPGVTTSPLPSTDPASNWMAKVDTVPAQEGGSDETVLGPGPWTKVVTKAAAGGVTGLAPCTGAGNSTFTVHGKPSDDAVYKANRRHENRHVADQKDAFDDAIGKWDKKLQDAKTADTAFTGASAADATAALWTAMGNTPEKAGSSFRSIASAKGTAFHGTADGGPMSLSTPVSNADCSTSAIDVTNPMP